MTQDYSLQAESGGSQSPMSATLTRPLACFSRGEIQVLAQWPSRRLDALYVFNVQDF
jgi:hypothetical protein